jgi:hypothetical protein
MSLFAKRPDARADAKNEADVEVMDPTPAGEGAGPAYGIADAMRLMRSLPVDQNMDLVVRVVRVTLSSVKVRMEDIIEDASRRQKSIQDSITALHARVADLQDQLEARRREIAAHEADLKETTMVKERLQHAEKATGQRPPPVPSAGPSPLAATLPPPPPPPPLGSAAAATFERDK